MISIARLACCILLIVFLSCKDKNNKPRVNKDSALAAIKKDTTAANDSAALPLSEEILSAIKIKNYQKLALFVNDDGIRFSPYGYIDTINDKNFSPSDFLGYATNKRNTKFTWGVYNGSGDKIILNVKDYFQKFVYDVDFLNAPQISLNKTISKSNSLNNIDSVYRNCIYTEFYFPGFEKKYEGMDWRSLKLVFKKSINKLYLIAIIHDQWTI
jgi:hypothetical protein